MTINDTSQVATIHISNTHSTFNFFSICFYCYQPQCTCKIISSFNECVITYCIYLTKITFKKFKSSVTGIMRGLAFIACASVLVALVASAPQSNVKDESSGDTEWWKTAVFYQIYPRSFQDSDGDGIGDLQGILQRLDHFKDAGVTATWLSPIFKSPQVDQGYDISDYRDVDPDYGTLDDLKQLIEKAKELGIKIILDLVPNHTSDQHEWFKKSVAKEPGYEDFYVWRDGKNVSGTLEPPNNWMSEFQGTAWEFNEERQQYYYHVFAPQQPDLNYANPAVVEAVKDVVRYWLDFGVDGFRVDAVPYLFEDPDFTDEPLIDGCTDPNDKNCLNHIYTQNQQSTYNLIYEIRDVLDNFTESNGVDTRVMMTEAYASIDKQMLYYGDGERVGSHFTFNFMLITDLSADFTADDVVTVVSTWLKNIPDQYTSNWVLGNHDNHRAATRLGKENADGFNMLTAILPGVMVTYNGEEIGMEDGEVTCEQGHDPQAIKNCSIFDQVSRDFERTPFQWDDSANAGFTTGTPWLPVSVKAKDVNLLAQNVDGVSSHYNVYKQLLEFRKNFKKEFILDSTSVIKVADEVLQVTRRVDDDEFVLVFNVGDGEDLVDFYRTEDTYKVVVASDGSSYNVGDTIEELTLKGHESVILQGIKSDK